MEDECRSEIYDENSDLGLICNLEEQVKRLQAENKGLEKAFGQVVSLMRESKGVIGIHLNGDIASWDWLVENEWLGEFEQILKGE